MNNIINSLKFNLSNLADSDLSCAEHIIYEGGTLGDLWGYVWKVININSTNKSAVIELLKDGNSIDITELKVNDKYEITDPTNSEHKISITLTNVFEGKEIRIAFLIRCYWTQQYSTLTMITDLPPSVVNDQSYTVTGRLIKNRLNETLETPINNEKVYINESGTKITETTTDSDGVFSLTFTYHINNNYEIYYPGTIDVTSNIKMLNSTTVEGATHLMSITFNEMLPDYVITAFKSVSNPVESVIQILTDKGIINDLVGWQLKDIQINKKQLIIYLRQTSTLSSTLSNIKSLNVGDVVANIIASAVVGATLGMVVGAIFPPAEPFTFTAGLIIGILVGIFSQWKVIISLLVSLPGYIIGSIFGTSEEKSTSGEANENAKEFLNVKLKECKDAYDLSSKNSDACILYAECMKNTYANFQEYTQGYLFQKVSTSLTLNAKNLKSAIDTKCINKFKAGEISCDDLITCTTNEGTNSIAQGDSVIYNIYPKDDPYIAPWEKDENGNGLFGNLLFYGALAAVGYVGYKILTSSKK